MTGPEVRMVRLWIACIAAVLLTGSSWAASGMRTEARGDDTLQERVVGSWSGTLRNGALSLRLLVEIRAEEDGGLGGSLVSLDQSAKALPLARLQATDDRLSFTVPGARAVFSGELRGDDESGQSSVAGEWRQGGFRGELVLRRADRSPAAGPGRQCVTALSGEGDPGPIVGEWFATLQSGEAALPLVLRVSRCDEAVADALRAELYSPMQNSTTPVTGITVHGDGRADLALAGIGAAFSGQLTATGAFEGSWQQGELTIPLVWRREARARPQAQAAAEHPPYESVSIRFPAADGSVRLAGTLTTPVARAPRASLVLATGSGPQDRDESVAGHRPFFIIADHLSRNGFQVLRYDDRGVGESGGSYADATIADHLQDLRGAVAWLIEHGTAPVGVLGHSLGGSLAAMAAVSSGRLSFLVLLAAPAVDGVTLLTAQTRDTALSIGVPADAAEALATFNRALYEQSLSDASPETIRSTLARMLEDVDAGPWAAAAPYLPRDPSGLAERLTSESFRFVLRHRPARTLQGLSLPVLAIYGGRDVQVSAALNAPAMEAALAGAGPGSKVVVMAGLNHLMQAARSGSPAEYAALEQTLSPDVLTLIIDWLGHTLP